MRSVRIRRVRLDALRVISWVDHEGLVLDQITSIIN